MKQNGNGFRVSSRRARGGRLTKWKGRAASIAPSLFVASATGLIISSGQAVAQEVITTLETNPVVIATDEDVTVTETGGVEINATADPAMEVTPSYSSTFTNNGLIGSSTTSVGSATALSFDNGVTGTGEINNFGSINAITDNGAGADGTGIVVSGSLDGTVLNAGTLQVEMVAADTGEAEATGVEVTGTLSGDLSSSGTMDVQAFGYLDATARGLSATDIDANLSISDTFTVSTFSSTANATSTGFYVVNSLSGNVTIFDTFTVGGTGEGGIVSTGFRIGQDLIGDFSNSATMSIVGISGSGTAQATGLSVAGETLGSIENSGTLGATIVGQTGGAASAIVLSGDFDGDLGNSGDILSLAQVNTSADAEALGFSVGGAMTGDIANTGQIAARATSFEAGRGATATSVYLGQTMTGDILNSGSVIAAADAVGDAGASAGTNVAAAAFRFDDAFVGTFFNSGSIDIQAEADNGPASAHGFQVDLGFTGDLSSTGSVDVSAIGTSFVSSAAFHLGTGELGGNFSSSGTIDVSSQGGTSETEAYGLYADDGVRGYLANEASVNVSASGDDDAIAYGFYAGNALDGYFSSSNSVGVAATSSSDTATAGGLRVSGGATSDVSNHSTFEITAEGDSVNAFGFYISGGLTGNFENEGRVDVEAEVTGAGDAEAYGLSIANGASGNIANSGTMSVSADGNTSVYAGAYSIGSGLDGSFTNSGTIALNAVSQTSSVEAYGVELSGGINGSFINSGLLTVEIATSGDAEAYGVYSSGDVTGDIINSGDLEIDLLGFTDAVAAGYYLTDSFTGDFIGTGSIDVTGVGADHVESYAVRLGDGANGSVSISDVVSVGAFGITSSSEAFGLYAGSDISGDIVATSELSIVAEGTDDVTAHAFYVNGSLGGAFTSLGTIDVTAESGAGVAEAYVLEVRDSVSGDVENSGTLTVEADGYADATAIGMELADGLDGSFSKSGRFEATAISQTGHATALGLNIDAGGITDDITHRGGLLASAEGAEATARGFDIAGNVGGRFVNPGTIRALATGTSAAEAIGFNGQNSLSGNAVNSGTIRATAALSGNNGTATATGIYIDDLQGNFVNRGTIAATATGGSSSNAYGVYLENFDGRITDVGNISAVSDNGDAYAIYLGTGSGTLDLDTQDEVTGTIRVADHDVNLDAQGGNSVFYFEDANTLSGTFTKTVSDGKSAWFVDDEGGDNPVYASIHPNLLLTSSDIVSSHGEAIGGVADVLLNTTAVDTVSSLLSYDDAATPRQSASQDAIRDALSTQTIEKRIYSAFRPFVTANVEAKRYPNVDDIDTDLVLTNGSLGVAGQLENGVSLAFGIGAFAAHGETGTTSFDTTGVYLNAGIGRQILGVSFGLDGGIGYLKTNRTRDIAGDAAAKADYNSLLATLHVGAQRSVDIGNGINLTGFGDARYTVQHDEGHSESNALSAASVEGATTDVLESRVGLEIARSFRHIGSFKGRANGVWRSNLGDTRTDVTVFSSTQTMTYAADDFIGASVALGYEKKFSPNLVLNVQAEHEIGRNAQGPSVNAGLTWVF